MLIKMEALPKIEEKVETLLGTRLSEYCTVNIMHTDFGSDFYCVLPPDEVEDRKEFYVQYRELERVADKDDYLSLRLKTATVRRWFKKRCLTFLFYVDLAHDDIYWIDPFEQFFEKLEELTPNQEAVVFDIPKKNLLSKNAREFPSEFFERMEKFDNYLFNGTLDRISRDIETFTEKSLFSEELLVDEKENSITIKYKSVSLEADFPKNDQDGNCSITFARLLKVSDPGVHLNHKEILGLFYFGKETDARLGMRKYIGLYLEDLGQYFVDFGNSVAYLYQHEVDELGVVVDTFIKKYVAKITDFLKDLQSFAFEPYYGDYRRFKLMQLDVEMWEKVREHVQKYQTNNGAYENGYIFSPYADPNQIGVDDDQGRELFSVYGYYKQSDMDLEKLVVDVVWEYIDYSTSGIEAGQTYNVADTYAFFINELLPNFFTNEQTIKKRKLFRTKLVKVYKTQTKEEIEKKIFIPKYKLTQYPNGNTELAETFRYLSDYLKAQEFYGFDPIAFENLLEGFDNLLRAELAIGGESSKAWYQEKKEDLLKDVKQLKLDQENDFPSDGYFLANTFSKLEAIVSHYKGSFDGKRIQESELLCEFADLIAEYNEDRLIRLLLS